MKKMILCAWTALYSISCIGDVTAQQQQRRPVSSFDRPVAARKTRIQVAILLDTSGSMEGLIEQAKSRLWNIINSLSTLRFQGQQPQIEIALYEYGNDGIPASNQYVRMISPLTTDLDLISEKLFALRTNGGEEYCGAVIRKATQQLAWSDSRNDIRLIYIAGNEPFTQGGVSYKEAIGLSNSKMIGTNTIYCGDYTEGINSSWKDGALRGNGEYFNINSNEKIRFVATPYDDEIAQYNDRLNSTYVQYGASGAMKKDMQMNQDVNAYNVSQSLKVERSISKSKAAYNNQSWDLVDRMKMDKGAVKTLEKKYLPKELDGKSEAEIEAYVVTKTKEREAYQDKINTLAKQRQAYIDKKTAENTAAQQDDLGTAINNSIMKLANKKGYTVDKN